MRKKYKYHYLYKVERLDTKEYYIGIRSCDVDPIDDNYWGSGIRITATIKKHGKDKFIRIILAVFDTRKEVSLAESNMVTEEMLTDILCLNLKTGGEYETGVAYSDSVKDKISVSLKSFYTNPDNRLKQSNKIKQAFIDDPTYKKRLSEARRRVLKDPKHRAKVLEIVRRSFLETDRSQKIKDALNKPDVKIKRSNSMKLYCNTPNGKKSCSMATKDRI